MNYIKKYSRKIYWKCKIYFFGQLHLHRLGFNDLSITTAVVLIYGNLRNELKLNYQYCLWPHKRTQWDGCFIIKRTIANLEYISKFGSYYIVKKCQMIHYVYHDIIKLHFSFLNVQCLEMKYVLKYFALQKNSSSHH